MYSSACRLTLRCGSLLYYEVHVLVLEETRQQLTPIIFDLMLFGQLTMNITVSLSKFNQQQKIFIIINLYSTLLQISLT